MFISVWVSLAASASSIHHHSWLQLSKSLPEHDCRVLFTFYHLIKFCRLYFNSSWSFMAVLGSSILSLLSKIIKLLLVSWESVALCRLSKLCFVRLCYSWPFLKWYILSLWHRIIRLVLSSMIFLPFQLKCVFQGSAPQILALKQACVGFHDTPANNYSAWCQAISVARPYTPVEWLNFPDSQFRLPNYLLLTRSRSP